MSTKRPTLDRLRRVTDLFTNGKTLTDGEDDSGPISVWLQKPHSFQRSETQRDGIFGRNRRMLGLGLDSHEVQIVMAGAQDLDDNKLIETILAPEKYRLGLLAIADVRADPDWVEDLLVRVLVLLVRGGLLRCRPCPPDPADPAAARAAGEPLLLLDVRSTAAWSQGLIPGAVRALLPELAGRLEELPADRDAPVVVYCRGPGCNGSNRAGLLLARAGYVGVRELVGGSSTGPGRASRSSPTSVAPAAPRTP